MKRSTFDHLVTSLARAEHMIRSMNKPSMKIVVVTIHERLDEILIGDDELLCETYSVSDDGGDYDDSEEYQTRAEADADAEDRVRHYADRGVVARVDRS